LKLGNNEADEIRTQPKPPTCPEGAFSGEWP